MRKNNLEKDLEDKFCVMFERAGIEYGESPEEWREKLEQFILKREKALLKELADKIKGMKKDIDRIREDAFNTKQDYFDACNMAEGRNQTIKEVLKTLK